MSIQLRPTQRKIIYRHIITLNVLKNYTPGAQCIELDEEEDVIKPQSRGNYMASSLSIVNTGNKFTLSASAHTPIGLDAHVL